MTLTGSVSLDESIAGCLSGAASTVLLHPLDLLKIRLQVADDAHVQSRTITRPTLRGTLQTILSTDAGLKGLYRGVTPNLVGSMASWGLYFGFYAKTKEVMRGTDKDRHLSPNEHLFAAALAGVIYHCD